MYQQDKKNDSDAKVKVVAVDLFCGAGGLTRGLLDAGIEVRMGVDFDDNFRRTYTANNPSAVFYRADIKCLNGSDLERQLNIMPSELFFLTACAPCQPFSRHNKDHYYDRRKSLLLEVGRILCELEKKPDILFLENVPAITRVDGGRVLKQFYKILASLGYNFKGIIVDAKKYGVPQTRKRFIMIGVKQALHDADIIFPAETHGKGLLPYKTVLDTIKHLPVLRAGQRHDAIPNHECAEIRKINLQRLRETPRNGGSRTSWRSELVLDCHKSHNGHKDVYGRMKWDVPSPTLTCKCVSISNGRFGHPTQLRAISLKEAALLQTFPDSYEFFGAFRNMAMQIGNAVPPSLAKVFGEHLVALSQKVQSSSEKIDERPTDDKLAILSQIN